MTAVSHLFKTTMNPCVDVVDTDSWGPSSTLQLCFLESLKRVCDVGAF